MKKRPHGWMACIGDRLAPSEVEDKYGIPWRKVHRLCRDNEMGCVKINRLYWIEAGEVEEYLKKHKLWEGSVE